MHSYSGQVLFHIRRVLTQFLFIESCWQKSHRVLVYEESGCSMSAVAVIAYLIKKKKMQLRVSSVPSSPSDNLTL